MVIIVKGNRQCYQNKKQRILTNDKMLHSKKGRSQYGCFTHNGFQIHEATEGTCSDLRKLQNTAFFEG